MKLGLVKARLNARRRLRQLDFAEVVLLKPGSPYEIVGTLRRDYDVIPGTDLDPQPRLRIAETAEFHGGGTFDEDAIRATHLVAIGGVVYTVTAERQHATLDPAGVVDYPIPPTGAPYTSPVGVGPYLLLEDSGALLLEDSGQLLLEA